MPAIEGIREQLHWEYYDTLVRGVGASNVSTTTKLFSAANTGRKELTNMQEGGRLSSEEVFMALSIRFYVQFATASLYRYIEDGVIWTFNVGNKPMLGPLPLFCAPAGGGMSGYDVGTSAHVIGNGLPGWNNVLKFAKPVKINKNQHFGVDVEFFSFESLDETTSAINPLSSLNSDTGLKVVKCFLGGILNRAVQ